MGRRIQGAIAAAFVVAAGAGLTAGLRAADAAPTEGLDPVRATPRWRPGARDQGCTSCHDLNPTFSHPVDFAPQMEIPPQFPLASGRMTCLTCHRSGEEAGRHGTLRTAADTLCVQCHASTGRTAADAHALQLGSAHLLTQERGWGGVLRTDALDAETTACLGCHDDLLAQGVPHEPITTRRRRRGHDSHPVATPYRRTGAPDPFDGLRHPELVDDRIRLFDGNLGCGSCHSVYAPGAGLLVMPNDRSRLCMACHDL